MVPIYPCRYREISMKQRFTFSPSLFVLSLLFSLPAFSNPPVYAIGHMTNVPDALSYYTQRNVNAIEVDINFENGQQAYLHHGTPCDCSTKLPSGQKSVCSVANACNGKTLAERQFGAIAKLDQHALSMVYLDSKVSKLFPTDQEKYGKQVIELIESSLFNQGYKGIVIVSTGTTDAEFYLQAAVDRAKQSPNQSQIYFTYDMIDSYSQAKKALNRLNTKNLVYSTGLTSIARIDKHYLANIAAAKKDGFYPIIWTVDKEQKINDYFKAGALGVMTNQPGSLMNVVQQRGLTLAQPNFRP